MEKNSPEIVITANFLHELTVKSGASELRGISDHLIVDCALKALGVKELAELIGGKAVSSYASKKALIKLVGKSAAKLGLGWAGTAIAVYEFVDCMTH